MLPRVVYRGIVTREGHKQGYREVQEVYWYRGIKVTLVTGTERYKKGGHHISGWCC